MFYLFATDNQETPRHASEILNHVTDTGYYYEGLPLDYDHAKIYQIRSVILLTLLTDSNMVQIIQWPNWMK